MFQRKKSVLSMMQKQMNRGTVCFPMSEPEGKRIIIGSTEKLGVGTNIQTRMVAAHHIDCPWKPSDIEQREGRIIRQGNENEEVNIYRYVTKGSFDAYLWGIVETKTAVYQPGIYQPGTGKDL
mgnify:CR=1 FL=1